MRVNESKKDGSAHCKGEQRGRNPCQQYLESENSCVSPRLPPFPGTAVVPFSASGHAARAHISPPPHTTNFVYIPQRGENLKSRLKISLKCSGMQTVLYNLPGCQREPSNLLLCFQNMAESFSNKYVLNYWKFQHKSEVQLQNNSQKNSSIHLQRGTRLSKYPVSKSDQNICQYTFTCHIDLQHKFNACVF